MNTNPTTAKILPFARPEMPGKVIPFRRPAPRPEPSNQGPRRPPAAPAMALRAPMAMAA